MRLWVKRAEAMNHNYALVGYLCAPNPTIMKEAMANRSYKHNEAAKAIISKLLLPPDLVGPDRDRRRAELIHTFWMEYRDFTLRLGKFADPDIWLVAEDPMIAAHEWWSVYGLTRTEVLGQVACIVCSHNLGIGSAERHWKLIKAAKRGQRARTSTEKCKKSALIYGSAMQQRSRHREKKLLTAGKLWTDEDFESLKLDVLCKDVVETALSLPNKPLRIFRAWEEEWEKVPISANGNDVLEARLVRKYGGIKWLDPDNGHRLCIAHPNNMFFEKKRGNNKYLIFATYKGYDTSKKPDEQHELYDPWEKSEYDFYDQVIEFYEQDKSREVKCYTKGPECDSENDAEDD